MKHYLIVGGRTGIGASIVSKLREENHLMVTSRFPIEEKEYINYISYDVLEDELDLSFLEGGLDGIVYCPGSINLKPFKRFKPADFKADFDLQVVGAIKTIQSALPYLLKSDAASVVLFSTVAVSMGYNFHSQVATSKGAVEGLSKSLAAEYAGKIRFNCIAPSLTNTPLASKLLSTPEKKEANGERHPLGRVGEPEDIAEMAAFLLSEKSSWMSGQVLHVDGGMSSLRV